MTADYQADAYIERKQRQRKKKKEKKMKMKIKMEIKMKMKMKIMHGKLNVKILNKRDNCTFI